MDYPDYDDDGALATDGVTMLDDDDTEQGEGASPALSATGGGGNCAEFSGTTQSASHTPVGKKCLSMGSSFMSCGSQDKPEFPPIYRTVRKEKEKSMVTRHLHGDVITETEITDSGASVSKVETIGSFANAGDKRHNHTMHRYDFKNVRNLSTSFNASTLVCTSCQNEHKVLRREVEEADVGMDIPPVFVLSDQNFPSMIPAGGEGDGECLKILLIEHVPSPSWWMSSLRLRKDFRSLQERSCCWLLPAAWHCSHGGIRQRICQCKPQAQGDVRWRCEGGPWWTLPHWWHGQYPCN